VDVKPAVAVETSGVARGQPAVRGQAGGGSVPVATQQRRTAELDLAALVDPHRDAREWSPVVDDPATALGQPVGDRRTVPLQRPAGTAAPRPPPRPPPAAPGSRAGRRRRRAPGPIGSAPRRRRGNPPPAPALPAPGRAAVLPPGAPRSSTRSPPMWANGRQLTHPSPGLRSSAPEARTDTAASTAARVSSTSRGRPDEPEVGNDESHLGVRGPSRLHPLASPGERSSRSGDRPPAGTGQPAPPAGGQPAAETPRRPRWRRRCSATPPPGVARPPPRPRAGAAVPQDR
jgi:hypothetical protein